MSNHTDWMRCTLFDSWSLSLDSPERRDDTVAPFRLSDRQTQRAKPHRIHFTMTTSMKKTPLTVERLTAVLNEVARNHQTDLVVFTTSGAATSSARGTRSMSTSATTATWAGSTSAISPWRWRRSSVAGPSSIPSRPEPLRSASVRSTVSRPTGWTPVSDRHFAVADSSLANNGRGHPGGDDRPLNSGMVTGQMLYLT